MPKKAQAPNKSEARSEEAKAYRALYKSAVWRKLRALHLSSQPLCVMCEREGVETPADLVDHIKAHRGNRALFFDPDNLQSLCNSHHSKQKQQIERRGYSLAIDPGSGWPSDPNHPANR